MLPRGELPELTERLTEVSKRRLFIFKNVECPPDLLKCLLVLLSKIFKVLGLKVLLV